MESEANAVRVVGVAVAVHIAEVVGVARIRAICKNISSIQKHETNQLHQKPKQEQKHSEWQPKEDQVNEFIIYGSMP